jgi:hypothetical protein
MGRAEKPSKAVGEHPAVIKNRSGIREGRPGVEQCSVIAPSLVKPEPPGAQVIAQGSPSSKVGDHRTSQKTPNDKVGIVVNDEHIT